MSEHPIDKHFREGLGQYRAPVSEDLWAGIAVDQLKKSRAARFTKAGLLIVGLVAVGLVTWQFWPNEAKKTTAPIDPHVPAIASQDSPTTASVVPHTKEEHATTFTPKPDLISSSTKTKTSFQKQKATHKEKASTPPQPSIQASASTVNESTKSVTSITNRVNEPSTDAEAIQSASLYNALDEVTSPSVVPNLVPATASILTLPLPLLAPYEREAPQPEVTSELPSFQRSHKTQVEIDLLGGFAYAHQVLDTKSEESRSALNAREISEFPEVSYLAGVRASLKFSKRLSARTGLLYTQVRNQFEYEQGAMGSNPILIKSSNQIRLIEVPLMLGYELPGRRFHLAINAGATINLSTKATGRYLTPNQLEPIKLSEENIYRSNIGIGWMTSLTAAYDLGQGNSLLIEPTFKSYPGSFSLPDYGLKERYWVVGLQLGLRHRL